MADAATLCTCADDRATDLGLGSLPVPVWVFDARDRVVGWNRAAGDLYGLAPEYAVGQSVLLFIPHRDLRQFTRACEEVRRAGSWAGNLTTQTAVGLPRLVEASWAAGPDDTVIAVHTDVTDRADLLARQRRAERWQATRRLAAAMAAEYPRRADVRAFAGHPDPTANPIVQAPGDRVIVAVGEPVLRELLAAALDAVGYRVVVAADRFEAVRRLADEDGQVRAAVLGFGPATAGVAAELRRVRPMLPVVALGPHAGGPTDLVPMSTVPVAPDPGEFLCRVAEAVAGDRLNDGILFDDDWTV